MGTYRTVPSFEEEAGILIFAAKKEDVKIKLSIGIALALALLVLGGGMAFAHHNEPPTTTALPGGLGHLTYSVESRKGAGSANVDCSHGTVDKSQCYSSYTQTREGSGGSASTQPLKDFTGPLPILSGGQTVGSLPGAGYITFGGAYLQGGGLPNGSGRAWTGVDVGALGSISVAGGGAAAGPDGKPVGCVIVYAKDQSSSHMISKTFVTAGFSDEGTDYDTDVQVCGKVLG